MFRRLLTTLFLLACFLPAQLLAMEGAEVRHILSFPQRSNQYVHVQTEFPVESDTVEVAVPSWTPGSYLIRDFAADLERLQATTADGRPLRVRKVAKNRWRIDTQGAPELTLHYDVWAGERNVAVSWVESGIALLNGAGIFLYSEESKKWPQRVEVRMPGEWSRINTSLRKVEGENSFVARDYDELVDSPIVAGNTVEYDFEVDGHAYVLVLSGKNRFWDGGRSARDLARIVKTQQDFWGVNPFDRDYLFLNFFMDKFGGLEHDHSTVMMCNPWQMREHKDYIKWLGLVSHEFFHAWNVRRMRPEALAEYDYDQEAYTRELWLAEGLTSYYDDLLLFRSGLIDVGDYFELLAAEFRNYETTPGRQVRSAELASFDTWIKQYKPDENSTNSTVSYYRKGALIGFVTDMAIRRETGHQASLDTVMREMYSRYGPGGQGHYPPGAFEDLVEWAAGPAVREVVESMLQTTEDPDIETALDWYGLQLDRDPGRTAAEQVGEPAPAGFGVEWDNSGSVLLADTVVLGYPGADAGVLPGDELLAIDGMRVTPQNYQSRLQRLRPGETVELTLVRHERLIVLPATVGHQMADSYAITPKARIRNREKARMEAWLGRELKFVK
jgi:predicted metalloprotease with PDZ domain